MTFSQRLKGLMDVQKVSNYKLAKNLKVHPTTIKNWLDDTVPQGENLYNLANFFGVTTDYLLGNEKNPEDDITFDDFTYAFHGETKELSDAEKEMLLNMAKELAKMKRERDAKEQK